MERDTLDRFIAFIQNTYDSASLWQEILEIIIADELISMKSRGYNETSRELLRAEINELNPNNPRRLAWDIINIYAGVNKKTEAWAKAKAEIEGAHILPRISPPACFPSFWTDLPDVKI